MPDYSFLERQERAIVLAPAKSDREHFEKALSLKAIRELIRKSKRSACV